jgi:hypothetical protein
MNSSSSSGDTAASRGGDRATGDAGNAGGIDSALFYDFDTPRATALVLELARAVGEYCAEPEDGDGHGRADGDLAAFRGAASYVARMLEVVGRVPPADGTGPGSSERPTYALRRDSVVGRGAYGRVCTATRGARGGRPSVRPGKRAKELACKCLSVRGDARSLSRLATEVAVLSELRGHPNVIHLHDALCVDGEVLIITDLGRGGDLLALMSSRPRRGVTEAYAGTTRRLRPPLPG